MRVGYFAALSVQAFDVLMFRSSVSRNCSGASSMCLKLVCCLDVLKLFRHFIDVLKLFELGC